MKISPRNFFVLLTAGEKLRAAGVAALTILASVVELFSFALILPLINTLVDVEDQTGWPAVGSNKIIGISWNPSVANLLVLIFLIFVLKGGLVASAKMSLFKFSSNFDQKLSKSVFTSILKYHDLRNLDAHKSEFVRTVSLAQDFSSYSLVPAVQILAEASITLFLLIMIFVVDVRTSTILLTSTLVLCVVYTSSTKRLMKNLSGRKFHATHENLQHLMEALAGIREIRVMDRFEFFSKRFANSSTKLTQTVAVQNFLQSVPSIFLEIALVGSLAAAGAIIIESTTSNQEAFSIIGLYAAVGIRIIPSFGRVLSAIQNIRLGNSLFLEITSQLKEESQTIVTLQRSEELFLSLKEVSLDYDNSSSIGWRKLSLDFKRNVLVGISGPSGIGKTSLMNLMLGLSKATSGQVVHYLSSDRNATPSMTKVGFVPQDVSLIKGSIRENILFGIQQTDLSVEELEHVVERVGLNTLVQSSKLGLDSTVGEFGSRLSGGERQRVGIARALLGKPHVLFLDEPTSSLDGKSATELISLLVGLRGTCSVVVISHSAELLSNCDEVINLETFN